MIRLRKVADMPRRLILTTAILLGASASALADTIVRQDGSRVSGTITRVEGGFDVTTTDGETIFIKSTDIKQLIAGDEDGGDDRVNEDGVSSDLASLRRSVANIDDLDRIVGRYEAFVKRHPTDKLAAADLETWRSRQANHEVKHNGVWMNVAERDELVAKRALPGKGR